MILQMKRDVTSVVLFVAILHRLCMTCAMGMAMVFFQLCSQLKTYHICKTQHFSEQLECLTHIVEKERVSWYEHTLERLS